jgi:hypothetical protein
MSAGQSGKKVGTPQLENALIIRSYTPIFVHSKH